MRFALPLLALPLLGCASPVGVADALGDVVFNTLEALSERANAALTARSEAAFADLDNDIFEAAALDARAADENLYDTLAARQAASLAGQVLKNLTATRADTAALNSTLNGFGNDDAPNIGQLIAVQNAASKVSQDINSTTTTANKSAKFTKKESTKIFSKLHKDLLPATQQVLQNFVNHYNGFKKAGVQGVVKDNLGSQKALVDTLGKALAAKSVGPAAKKAAALQKKFLKAFDDAIAVYSK